MKDKLSFTPYIFEQITKTIVTLHDLLSDVTSRSDLMAQELIQQQDRIERLENILKERSPDGLGD